MTLLHGGLFLIRGIFFSRTESCTSGLTAEGAVGGWAQHHLATVVDDLVRN